MMFSSTIIGIKLLPTTTLHHQHTGEVMISVLLLRFIGDSGIITFKAFTALGKIYSDIGLLLIELPALLFLAFIIEKYLLSWLLAKFNRIKEYLFLLSIAWCLSLAQRPHFLVYLQK